LESTYQGDTVVSSKSIRKPDTSYSVWHYATDATQRSVVRATNGNVDFRSYKFYDSNGKLTEEKEEDLDRKTLNLSKHTYEPDGTTIRTMLTDSIGHLILTSLARYDMKHNRIEFSTHDSSGVVRNRNICKFDERGNIIWEEQYSRLEGWGLDRQYHYLSKWTYEYYRQ
jgi:hypothetical protein